MVLAEVEHRPAQVERERTLAAEVGEAARDSDEGILGQVLSHLRTSSEIEQVAIDVGVIIAGEVVPGLRIALPELLDQPRFRRGQAGRNAWIGGRRASFPVPVPPL